MGYDRSIRHQRCDAGILDTSVAVDRGTLLKSQEDRLGNGNCRIWVTGSEKKKVPEFPLFVYIAPSLLVANSARAGRPSCVQYRAAQRLERSSRADMTRRCNPVLFFVLGARGLGLRRSLSTDICCGLMFGSEGKASAAGRLSRLCRHGRSAGQTAQVVPSLSLSRLVILMLHLFHISCCT